MVNEYAPWKESTRVSQDPYPRVLWSTPRRHRKKWLWLCQEKPNPTATQSCEWEHMEEQLGKPPSKPKAKEKATLGKEVPQLCQQIHTRLSILSPCKLHMCYSGTRSRTHCRNIPQSLNPLHHQPGSADGKAEYASSPHPRE